MQTVRRLYSVFPIKLPLSQSQLNAYKSLRLLSLQIDPQAFISNYAREAAFADDIWREWLDSPLKQTLIASVTGTVQDTSVHEEERDDGDNASVDSDPPSNAGTPEEAGEWVGMASIIGPSGIPSSILAPFSEAGVGANWQIYGLYAMWVHPAHRGKGVGVQLIKACLEWVRANVDPAFSSVNDGYFEKVVALLVYDDNVAGRALYSRTGFTELEEVSAEVGQRWMVSKV